MNSTVKLAACLSVALVSSNCFAQSKDYVEIGYGKISIKELSEIKPTGIALSAKKSFDQFYLQGTYIISSDKNSQQNDIASGVGARIIETKVDTDWKQFTVLVGHEFQLSEQSSLDLYGGYSRLKLQMDATAEVEYIINGEYRYRNEIDVSANNDADLYHLELAYALSVDSFDAKAGIGFERINGEEGESSFVYLAEIGYHFTDHISANLNYRNADVYNNVGFNLRYSF